MEYLYGCDEIYKYKRPKIKKECKGTKSKQREKVSKWKSKRREKRAKEAEEAKKKDCGSQIKKNMVEYY